MIEILMGIGVGFGIGVFMTYMMAVRPLVERIVLMRYEGFRGDPPVLHQQPSRAHVPPRPRED